MASERHRSSLNGWRKTWPISIGLASSAISDWSFYNQGSDGRAGSADKFFDEALKFFGGADVDVQNISPFDRAYRLLELIRQRRTLLVLDGLETLQAPAGGPSAGEILDSAMDLLIKGLASENPGLCLVTSRLPIPGLHAASLSLETRNTRAFVSYSSKDQEQVERLVLRLLNRNDVPCSSPRDSIDGAQDWRKAIRSALSECTHFIVVLSPDSVRSQWGPSVRSGFGI